ncbi:hypothetical protein F4779DRAFT_59298 [Xylariaceae sp. FL0662B]|nr:hypothetical protein F4779DRAFT_59298 [Xylariaceae sp. FL0662B]
MCIYILLTPLCSHAPRLLAGPSCAEFRSELSRIHSDAAWTGAGRATLPFRLPESCSPRPGNVVRVSSGHWCGWECRNTYGAGEELCCGGVGVEGAGSCNGGGGSWDFSGEDVLRVGTGVEVSGGGDSGADGGAGAGAGVTRTLGMPDAEYGVPRLGVGWRE